MEVGFLDGSGYDALTEFEDLLDRFPCEAGSALARFEDIQRRGSVAIGRRPCAPPDLYELEIEDCSVFFVVAIAHDPSGAENLPCLVAVALVECDLGVGPPFSRAVAEATRRRSDNGI